MTSVLFTLGRCGALIGVAMSAALFFAGPTALLALTRKAPETLAPATTYLKLRLLTLPALILTMVPPPNPNPKPHTHPHPNPNRNPNPNPNPTPSPNPNRISNTGAAGRLHRQQGRSGAARRGRCRRAAQPGGEI